MNYSTNKIFADSNANAIIDRMFFEIGTVYQGNLENLLCLTGRAAAQLQGRTAKDCDNVILITSDAALFSIAGSSALANVPSTGVVRFRERIIFYFENLVLELWLSLQPMKMQTVSGIKVQDVLEINPILL